MKIRTIALALVLTSVAGGLAPALADDSDVATLTVKSATNARHTQTIRYDDIDLSKVKGAKIMLWRIKNAAEAVCENPAGADLSGLAQHRDCVRDTVNQTVAALNSPVVTAVNSGTQPPVT